MTLNDKLKTSNRIGYYFRIKDVKAFIKEQDDLAFCNGCGHKKNIPIVKPHIACCPENVWVVRLSDIDKLAGKELI